MYDTVTEEGRIYDIYTNNDIKFEFRILRIGKKAQVPLTSTKIKEK